jgi:FkbM family methyltransferase
VIEVEYGGTVARFDDTGNDPERPGVILGTLRKGVFYEHRFLCYIASLHLRGCYVDIGANVGNHTVFFSLICAADRVHSFEPQPSVYRRLLANVALNGLSDRVVAHNVALTNQPCVVKLRNGRQVDSGRSDGDVDTSVLVVPGRRLDDVVQEPVALMKIDVEGMEPVVLEGASDLIKNSRPVIFAEAATVPEFAAVCRVLQRLHYRPTGRCFNSTPTYEFTHVRNPVARLIWDAQAPLWRLAESAAGRGMKRMLPPVARRRIKRMLVRSAR